MTLTVAWTDTTAERGRGLMEVEDLGDLDGMVFDLGTEREVAFTMRNALIPLDIYFYAGDGTGVGMLEMTPCATESCPTYQIESSARYALEVPAGSMGLDPGGSFVIP